MIRAAAVLAILPQFATAESLAERVLVVYNKSSKDSTAAARHYQTKRGIPPERLCGVGFDNRKIAFVPYGADSQIAFDWPGHTDYVSVRKSIRGCLDKAGRDKSHFR